MKLEPYFYLSSVYQYGWNPKKLLSWSLSQLRVADLMMLKVISEKLVVRWYLSMLDENVPVYWLIWKVFPYNSFFLTMLTSIPLMLALFVAMLIALLFGSIVSTVVAVIVHS